jgi:hypothetical protein
MKSLELEVAGLRQEIERKAAAIGRTDAITRLGRIPGY